MAVIDRVTISRARRAVVRLLRAVAQVVLAVFYVTGWLVGNVVVGVLAAITYMSEAVKLGWTDARGGRRGAD